jgi:hypothetical protein
MNLIEISRKHLELSKVSYVDHLIWALKSGVILIAIGIASIIHGIAPFLFEGTTAKKIIEIFYQHLYNHPNPEYQIAIREEFKKSISN